MSAYYLARVQFALTIGFHIVFPATSIGLATYLVVLEGAWLRTRKPVYLDAYRFWLKIFAIVFGIGVVSGLVMGYELGLNWSGYTEKVGAILGPLLTYETMTAFFLEAGFLGVMLFGMNRVGPRLHFAATCAVAFGTHVSAFWILAGNSWMQTPQGDKIVDGRFVPTNWLAIIFNPSMPYRFVHMMGAAYLSVALMVGAVGAWHVLHDRKNDIARLMLSMALWMVLFAAPCQIVAGDVQGDNTLRYQPQKVAAMEGDWVQPAPGAGEPLVLFAIPSMKTESDRATIEIPRVASWYLTHTWAGTIKGLREFAKADIPYVPIVFFAFRVMVGLGLLMLAYAVVGAFLRRRGVLYDTRWFLRIAVAMGPAGYLAMLAGWTVTETGRQPYTVYGLLRTINSVSPIGTPGVAASLAAFAVVYAIVFGAAATFLLRLMAKAPEHGEPGVPNLPHRSAGITPGPAGVMHQAPGGAE
ncbi:MAG TPA: cytochrome ubiquinol oxidase subunit I [Acetobacteraceae bacterium]|nr:cytochrome ubiquinol oxidase subunit I [Acetobacteraceae bacterium]